MLTSTSVARQSRTIGGAGLSGSALSQHCRCRCSLTQRSKTRADVVSSSFPLYGSANR
jgi:hypothetical protein